MKNLETGLYLDEPTKFPSFFNWRWWVELLPVIAKLTLPAPPPVSADKDDRIQQYLDALRDHGAFPNQAPP